MHTRYFEFECFLNRIQFDFIHYWAPKYCRITSNSVWWLDSIYREANKPFIYSTEVTCCCSHRTIIESKHYKYKLNVLIWKGNFMVGARFIFFLYFWSLVKSVCILTKRYKLNGEFNRERQNDSQQRVNRKDETKKKKKN